MRSHVLLFGLLLALLASGFALAGSGPGPRNISVNGNQRSVYVPLVMRDSSKSQPNQAATSTATATETAITTPTASATPTATAPTPSHCDPQTDLGGSLVANNQGHVMNHSASCAYEIGLASYRAFDRHIGNQELFDWTTATIAPGQALELTIAVPDCATQIDLFYGPLLVSLDGQRYGERILASRFVAGANYCVPGTPAPTTTASPTETVAPTLTPTSGGG